MNNDTEWLIDLFKTLGVSVDMAYDGESNLRIEYADKVEVYKAYVDLLAEYSEAKLNLIFGLEKRISNFDDGSIEKLRLKDEIQKLKLEILDIEVNKIAKSHYVKIYQGRSKFAQGNRKLVLEKAKQDVPKYAEIANKILEDVNHLVNKKNAILLALLNKYDDLMNGDDDNLWIYLYTQFQAILGKL